MDLGRRGELKLRVIQLNRQLDADKRNMKIMDELIAVQEELDRLQLSEKRAQRIEKSASAAAAAAAAGAAKHDTLVSKFEQLKKQWLSANRQYLGSYSSSTGWYVGYLYESADQKAKHAALNKAAADYADFFGKNSGELTADELGIYALTVVKLEVDMQTRDFDLAGKAAAKTSTAPKIAALASSIEEKTKQLDAMKAAVTPVPKFELASATAARKKLLLKIDALEKELTVLNAELKTLGQSGGGKRIFGSRAKVMHGGALCTYDGLTKDKLKYNSRGRIVNKCRSNAQSK